MKKRFLLILMLMNGVLCTISQAQNPDPNWATVKYPNLLITECRLDATGSMYVEITNMEDTAVDMSSIRLVNAYWASYSNFDPATRYITKPWRGELYLTDTLQAGKSMVVSYLNGEPDSTATALMNNNPKMISKITWPVFRQIGGATAEMIIANPKLVTDINPGLGKFLEDSLFTAQHTGSRYYWFFRAGGGQSQMLLLYDYNYYQIDTVTALNDTISNSIVMDVCNAYTEDAALTVPPGSGSVAGIAGATGSHTMIRKTSGFQTADWINESRGISSEDSQWWLVPNAQGNEVYTTVGNSGDYSISFTSKENSGAVVNHDNKTISVPWESLRGEPVLDNCIDFGDGMAWTYVKDTIERADSAYTRVQDGDLLEVYAFGNDMETATYTFKVLDAASNLAIARSKTRQNANGAYLNSAYFNITEDVPVMDSILNIQYQLRVDTLFKYIETPPNATAEIVFVDGADNRVDLKDGDLLRVTAEDKTTVKDYYIQVNEYAKSNNTSLSAITWPDYDKNDFFEWEYLKHDTLPDFSTNKKNYLLLLPGDYTTVPAIMATASDLNAKVRVERATSLTGTIEQRTTTFTVYSEASDTIYSEYAIVFKLDEGIQRTNAEPFISEILRGRYNGDNYIQLFNPNNGTEALDMGHYLFVNADASSDEFTAITNYQSPTTPTDAIVHKCYVPGYKYSYDTNGSDDPADWTWKNGVVGGITPDVNVNAYTVPGDVFIMSAFNKSKASESILNQNGDSTVSIVDMNFVDNPDFPNAAANSCAAGTNLSTQGLFLYKILNDSILNGTKGIWESADDYKLVDRVSGMNDGGPNGYGYANGWLLIREPDIQKGALEDTITFSTSPDSCDWIPWARMRWASADIKMNGRQLGNFIGQHEMNPITFHLSTVTSNVYKVDLGYEGDLNIVGEVSASKVDEFLGNLNKADSLQSITVMKGGVAKDSTAMMEDGDIVVVLSADSVNTTNYTVQNRALSANTDLEAVADMGIVVDNQNLTLSGFDYTKPIADVLAGVTTVDPASIINVVDTLDNLVSLLTFSKDTALAERMITTKVFGGVMFEVVAEDGSTAKYSLVPDASSSDAYLTSNVFTVVQEGNKSINGVASGYSVGTFLSYLIPSGNATLLVKNKAGGVRADGLLHYDDYVVVTSEDGTKTRRYTINFYAEINPDVITKVNDINMQENTSLIKVYPNPTSSFLNIQNALVGSVVQVISLNGTLVYTKVVNNNNLTIDMGSMNNGVYFVRLVGKDNASVFKVVKR